MLAFLCFVLLAINIQRSLHKRISSCEAAAVITLRDRMRGEQLRLAVARANVMMYDDLSKQWIPASCGPQPCTCEVSILHQADQRTFTILARTVEAGQVALSSSLERGMRYNEATPTFHQWRDNKVEKSYNRH